MSRINADSLSLSPPSSLETEDVPYTQYIPLIETFMRQLRRIDGEILTLDTLTEFVDLRVYGAIQRGDLRMIYLIKHGPINQRILGILKHLKETRSIRELIDTTTQIIIDLCAYLHRENADSVTTSASDAEEAAAAANPIGATRVDDSPAEWRTPERPPAPVPIYLNEQGPGRGSLQLIEPVPPMSAPSPSLSPSTPLIRPIARESPPVSSMDSSGSSDSVPMGPRPGLRRGLEDKRTRLVESVVHVRLITARPPDDPDEPGFMDADLMRYIMIFLYDFLRVLKYDMDDVGSVKGYLGRVSVFERVKTPFTPSVLSRIQYVMEYWMYTEPNPVMSSLGMYIMYLSHFLHAVELRITGYSRWDAFKLYIRSLFDKASKGETISYTRFFHACLVFSAYSSARGLSIANIPETSRGMFAFMRNPTAVIINEDKIKEGEEEEWGPKITEYSLLRAATSSACYWLIENVFTPYNLGEGNSNFFDIMLGIVAETITIGKFRSFPMDVRKQIISVLTYVYPNAAEDLVSLDVIGANGTVSDDLLLGQWLENPSMETIQRIQVIPVLFTGAEALQIVSSRIYLISPGVQIPRVYDRVFRHARWVFDMNPRKEFILACNPLAEVSMNSPFFKALRALPISIWSDNVSAQMVHTPGLMTNLMLRNHSLYWTIYSRGNADRQQRFGALEFQSIFYNNTPGSIMVVLIAINKDLRADRRLFLSPDLLRLLWKMLQGPVDHWFRNMQLTEPPVPE